MATLDSMGLMQHRRWEDVALMILGAMVLVSPMWFDIGGNTTMAAATALVGAAIVVLGGLEQIFLRRWEEILTLFCGLWMVASPFTFEYGGALRNWHMGLGIAVALLAILELWQDRNRNLEA
ncbi:SPW repeat domain-containing protein [Aminobacter sp. Piv2-1]|uniref:SPW repeat domain-containing protein n=1 Tax=Aminobacter sp. Piv2-1 TaxID=3031122 RepID=UPI00309C4CF0